MTYFFELSLDNIAHDLSLWTIIGLHVHPASFTMLTVLHISLLLLILLSLL